MTTGIPIKTVLKSIENNDIFADSALGISTINIDTNVAPIINAIKSENITMPKAILMFIFWFKSVCYCWFKTLKVT